MTLILGRKQGKTHVFREDGTLVGVTVGAAGPCTVTQVRTHERDGYDAIQLGYADVREKLVTRPLRGHFAKAGCAPRRFLREERLAAPATLERGATVSVALFNAGDLVDVIGTTKGRGFSGTIKRHGFQRGPETHGSMNVRQPGSIASKRIGKTAAGKRMSGHYGHARQTTKNLEIVRIDAQRNLLFLKGAIPGPTGGYVEVQTARTGVKKIPQAVPGGKDKKAAKKEK